MLASIMEDPTAAPSEQIRAGEAILDRGLGKVVELPDQRAQPFAFFQQVTPEQLALARQVVNALPENTDGDPSPFRLSGDVGNDFG